MNTIQKCRRQTLGPGPLCSPSEWARGVFAMFDKHAPAWRSHFDAAAIELALIDLSGGDERRPLNPVKLDALAELLAQFRGEPAKAMALMEALGTEISASPGLQQVLFDLERYFRVGQALKDPDLRAVRLGVFTRFAEILEPLAEKVLTTFERRLDDREEYAAARHPLMTQPDLAPAATPEDPDVLAARVTARRVLKRIGTELTPKASRALRLLLGARGALNLSQAATIGDVSVQTVCRAMKMLNALCLAEDIEGEEERRAVFEAMCEAAAA